MDSQSSYVNVALKVKLYSMNYRKEVTARLLDVLKKLERKLQFQGLKKYLRSLKKKKPLNGKEKYILRGARARLRRLQYDRRSQTLGLREFRPCYERECEPDELVQTDYLTWDKAVGFFYSR